LFPVWSAPIPARSLVINEINVGGSARQFIEVRNSSTRLQSLSGMTLETSQGSFALDGAAPLGAGACFFLFRAASGQDGFGPGGRSLGIEGPVAHVMQDTVLLKKGGTILDAVSYGTTRDTSARYNAAVQAGQFVNGSFVDTSTCYTSVNLGRSGQSADTNSLASDWALHGGANSYNLSPGTPNTATLKAEKDIVRHIQAILSQVFVNALGMNVTYADHGFLGGSPPATDHSFWIDGPDFGAHVLQGRIVDRFVALGNGQYDIVSTGILADDLLSLELAITDSVRTTAESRSIAVTLVAPTGDAYTYTEDESSVFSGSWGNHQIVHMRTVTGWDGIKRVTSFTQSLAWPANQPEVTSATSSVSLTRDFPANPPSFTDYITWVQNGSQGMPPNAPYTTETIDFVSNISGAPGSVTVDFPSYTIDHGAFGSAVQDNCKLTLIQTAPYQVSGSYVYDFAGPISAHVENQVIATMDPGSQDVAIDGTFLLDDADVVAFRHYIDPIRPPAALGGFFEWVGWGVATFVTGAACGIGTAIATGTTVVVGTVTLGTGVPAGAVGIGATAGACATATTFVGNSLWPD
jgi:hypothetical protein